MIKIKQKMPLNMNGSIGGVAYMDTHASDTLRRLDRSGTAKATQTEFVLAFIKMCCCLLLGFASMAHSAEQIGRSVVVLGEVTVRHQTEETQALRVNAPVFLKDLIKVAKASRAKLMLLDDSILKLGPYAQVQLTQAVIGRTGSQTTVEQFQGRLKALIGKKLTPGSHYKINTPVAVAGVRGTEFEIWIGINGKTAVRCLESVVDLANINPAITGQVILNENYYSIVEEGKPPTEPRFIAPQESLASVFEKGELEDEEERIDAQSAEVEVDRQGVDNGEVDPVIKVAGMPGSVGSSAIGSPGSVTPRQTQLGSVEASGLQISAFSESSAAGQRVRQLLELGVIGRQPAAGTSALAEELFADLIDEQQDSPGTAFGDPLLLPRHKALGSSQIIGNPSF